VIGGTPPLLSADVCDGRLLAWNFLCHEINILEYLQVDDLQSASGYLGEVGVTTLGSPANSADDKPAMFLHPETNMGVLIKLQQANHFSARDDMPRAVGT
jgi:hypothetical protein